MNPLLGCLATLALGLVASADDKRQQYYLHQFQRIQLTDVYYSEGASFGDINGNGVVDVVHGPYWFAGPDFKNKHQIYPAEAQNRNRYANNFFSWVYDFNGDGANDVFTVGFPGTPAYVYENPGKKKLNGLWRKHRVFDWVSNESPHFTQLVGDQRPELVCTRNGQFGYATIAWKKPFQTWVFHPISGQVASKRFGHGLGVGDIDGDRRMDIITKDGWYQQPTQLTGDPRWTFHRYPFTRAGGAEMYAYDVNGDGYNDVITSLAAHAFGLAWFEQVRKDGKITFKRHLIMGKEPAENRYGVVFSELHTVNLADINGDGLKDIVTGKTYWSHHRKAPGWNDGAVVYWFQLVRGKKGVDWIPHKADGTAGVGRQLQVGDLNGDALPDIVIGGMKGCHVLIHNKKKVSKKEFDAHQPTPRK